MKFALAWICLAGFGISATYETDIHGHEGKHVTVECVHGHASTNKKYSCKDPCNDDDVLVSSDRSPNKRFSLKDFGNSTFTVTITDLQESDSGIYWCGVNRSAALDTYLQITLRINKADTHMTLRTTTSSTTVTTSDSQTSKSRSFTPAPNDITTSFTGLLMVFIMGPAGLLTFGLVLCMMNMQNRETNRSKDPEHHDADTINICTKTARDIMETQQQDDTFNVVYFTVSQSPPANQIQDTLVSSTLYFQSKIGQL
ncbi:CMRF35-like molecule 5 isoform X4 [Triplophysa dalaica]|uniref:CMRF35-like molecule 5 isoform X4 n=1 Tax=Triplophysa dalaica TaxID=1582913 RepID=UPI0024DF8461|nr:CMRF35-like molecule 5 isoform X4 [Triplophysa dalaica]